jgi:hypothetical protein
MRNKDCIGKNYSPTMRCLDTQLQRKEQAKDTLIAMSRKSEVVALQIANGGWNIFYRLP